MRIGIVGPGAMGCFFASRLARAGEDVTLIDHRPERARLLAQRGIAVLGCGNDRPLKIPVGTAASLAGGPPFDLLAFFVKAYCTAEAARQAARYARDGAIALTLQNGLGNADRLGEQLPGCRIVAGATGLGVTGTEPGVVHYAGPGPTVVGPHGDRGHNGERSVSWQTPDYLLNRCEEPQIVSPEASETITALLTRAGVPTTSTADIRPSLWEKVAVNAAINPLTALLGVCNGALLGSVEAEAIMRRVTTECAAAAAGAGVAIDAAVCLETALAVCEKTAANRSSMLQDLRRGRRTEIDQINGAVAVIAAAAGRSAPANTVLTALVSAVCENRLGTKRV